MDKPSMVKLIQWYMRQYSYTWNRAITAIRRDFAELIQA